MPKPGDVVTVEFVGATATKRRPAVVVSSELYHAHRPDVVLAALTSNLGPAREPTDYVLKELATCPPAASICLSRLLRDGHCRRRGDHRTPFRS
jgi:mRNA-degrading endonuclease toxin of MazEF toxin-antitoxin module